MNGRRLRSVVKLQRATETRTAAGGVSRSWVTLDHVPARIRPLLGKEQFEAARVGSESTHKVNMQRYPGLKVSDRFQYEDGDSTRIFQIVSVRDPEERHREHVVMCKEKT
jgi:SPP1 family predicted phage head-tail adaptor